jgi:hypothetical protein
MCNRATTRLAAQAAIVAALVLIGTTVAPPPWLDSSRGWRRIARDASAMKDQGLTSSERDELVRLRMAAAAGCAATASAATLLPLAVDTKVAATSPSIPSPSASLRPPLSSFLDALPNGVLSVFPPDGARFLSAPFPDGSRNESNVDPFPFPVHMIWEGDDMPEIYRRNARSWLLQHAGRPGVALLVWSNSLAENVLRAPEFAFAGLRAAPGPYLVRYAIGRLLSGPPGAAPAPGVDLVTFFAAATQSTATIVHISDVLRLVIVWRFGGIYTDCDGVSLRPVDLLPSARNHGLFVVHDRSYQYPCLELTGDTQPVPMPSLAQETVGTSMPNIFCALTGLLAFPPGHILLGHMLAMGLSLYERNRNTYGPLGAPLILAALRTMSISDRGALRPLWARDALCDTMAGDYVPGSGAWVHRDKVHIQPRADIAIARASVLEAMARCVTVQLYCGGKSWDSVPVPPNSLLGLIYSEIESSAQHLA